MFGGHGSKLFPVKAMATHHFILLASIVGFAKSNNSNCHACLDSVCYSKTPILIDYRVVGQMAVDKSKNIVYFHYEDAQSIDYTAAFDLDGIRVELLPDIGFSFARAVDQSTRHVYIGGARGIYKYNPTSNSTTRLGLFDKTIWQMQFKNKLYYTILNTRGLFTFQRNKSKSIAALSSYMIDDFVIDHREDIYFISSRTQLYRLKKGANIVTVIATDVKSLTIDNTETVHFVVAKKKVLYKVESNTDDGLIAVGVFAADLPLRSVFDNNNNMISIYDENEVRQLFYVMPNYGQCTVKRRLSEKKTGKLAVKGSNEAITDSELVIHRVNVTNTIDAAVGGTQ